MQELNEKNRVFGKNQKTQIPCLTTQQGVLFRGQSKYLNPDCKYIIQEQNLGVNIYFKLFLNKKIKPDPHQYHVYYYKAIKLST